MQIVAWLEELGLGQYAPAFADNDIDAQTLVGLTAEDLKELGIASLGHRKRLLAAIAALAAPRPGVPGSAEPAPVVRIDPQQYTPRHLAERILRSRGALEGERKQVTVLFADIKGSMELLAGLDAEDARAVLDPAIDAMMRAVSRYDGTVNKVLGDGIMALFGAPIAQEDHAVRACYAALAMHQAMRRLGGETRARFGVDVEIRIGLNSGDVVVRAIRNDLSMDYDAIGPTTHLAARMEQLARPGSTRMTLATHRLAEGFVEANALGAMPVKGVAEPVEVFELTGAGNARTRLQATGAAGFTRFVGREPELAALDQALGQARLGHGQAVAVAGEPGVGKSRLFHEFVHSRRAEGWLALTSGSVSHGRASVYLPVIELLRGYFAIQPADEPRRIREKVTGKLLTLDEKLRPALLALLALMEPSLADDNWSRSDPARHRQRIVEAVKALLLAESAVQPLMVMFEDLHWIDSESLAIVASLLENLPAAPILLLVNFRPEFQDAWSGKSHYARLRVDLLPPQSAETLLDDLLGPGVSLAPLKRALIGRTEGNPFFLEESVRELVECGALVGRRGNYRPAAGGAALVVPATVKAVLAARIDRLQPEEKYLLQTAAVIGKNFAWPLLREVAQEEEATLDAALAGLKAAEFIYETQLFPDPAYTFKHALTHEVTLSGLLAERRVGLHARCLEAMERLYADRLGEHAERLAQHAERGQRWEKAYRHGAAAGLAAVAVNANRSALAMFEIAAGALARLPESDENLAAAVDLRFQMRDVLFVLGEPARIPALMDVAEELALRLADQRRLIEVLL
ncbi:MAG: hypothetical protein FJX68_13190 [Alphaproteobacteria bacterium]|nr:hypothetical protein [Alphaproteobacteria bacterium]